MQYPEPKIFCLGDSAMTIEFGERLDIETNQLAIKCAALLESHPFPGFIEAAPTYASTTVFYDPVQVVRECGDVTEICRYISGRLLSAASSAEGFMIDMTRLIEVPARFGGDAGPDLTEISTHCGISEDEVIEIFTGHEYRVFMLGFLPGFAYMGKLDERIAMPRRDVPRTRVPAGSIGIADHQTGIYPLDSPGGWQLIGHTEMTTFDVCSDPPWAFSPGDRVRFVPV
jgi:inhibitor of KinA